MGRVSFSPPFKKFILSHPLNSLNSIMDFFLQVALSPASTPRVSINVSSLQVTFPNIPVPQFLTSLLSLSFSQLCIQNCLWKSVVKHPHDMASPYDRSWLFTKKASTLSILVLCSTSPLYILSCHEIPMMERS